MIVQLLFALALTCVTVVIHAVGSALTISHLNRTWQQANVEPMTFAAGIQIIRVVLFLLLLHVMEATAWAFFYRLSGDLPDIETAIYFSITSYTTVGYGDVILPPPWRVLGPIEAGVGILMFGWSTAIMVAAVTKLHSARMPIQYDRSTGVSEKG
jgi:hypothetical protein